MSDHTTNESTVKLCECGCGQPAPLAKKTSKKNGYVKGQPVKFIVGHYAKVQPWPSAAERFWPKVAKGTAVECWPWTASTYLNGYGQFWTGTNLTPAHRFAYTLTNGPIPSKMIILHTCDNPLCCNPAHLRLGTQQDNIDDMHQKRRNGQPIGERQRSAKFTEDQVRCIRDLHATGQYSNAALAKQFGVSTPTIRSIVLRFTWKHI